jgi:hypothetical protein
MPHPRGVQHRQPPLLRVALKTLTCRRWLSPPAAGVPKRPQHHSMRSALEGRNGSRLQQSASLQLHSCGHRPIGLSIPLLSFFKSLICRRWLSPPAAGILATSFRRSMCSALEGRNGSRLQHSAPLQLLSCGRRPAGLNTLLWQGVNLSALAVTSCSGHAKIPRAPLYAQCAGGS